MGGGSPIVLVAAGGVPITYVASRGIPMTVTASLGMPCTVVASGGMPVTPISEAGVVLEAETFALLAAMTVQPTTARATQINTLTKALKTAGIWDKLDAFWVMAAHDEQAGRLNWKAPATFTLTKASAPVFTADRGYATDGAASYVDTTWIVGTSSVNFVQDSATMFYWSRTAGQAANFPMGTGTTIGNIKLNGRTTADLFSTRINETTATIRANTDGSGLIAETRSASNVTQGYRNGAAVGAAGATASAALTGGRINFGRTFSAAFSAVEFAAGGMGGALNATEHAALYAALNTYMTAVGAA